MADTKITDLTALTGANTATGDQFVLVDVSDSTMAASGTDKKITRAQLAVAMSAEGVVGADVLWAANGDILIGTANDAGTVLSVGTTAGQALCAVPSATNKLGYAFPQGAEEAGRGLSGALASTYDRGQGPLNGNRAELSTGRISVYRVFLPKGITINTITFFSATTALSVGANQWFGLFNNTFGKLAVTADDTSTAWAANTAKTLTISGGFVTTYSGLHFLGCMVKATTVPTLQGIPTSGDPLVGTVKVGGVADSSLTNPASCPSTLTFSSSSSNLVYAEAS